MDRALDVLFFIEHWINNRDAWPPCLHARVSVPVSKPTVNCIAIDHTLHAISSEGRREARDIASWDELDQNVVDVDVSMISTGGCASQSA